MEPGKEDPQVQPLAHEDMHKLDDQQLESVQGGVSPQSTLEAISTSRDSSGPSSISRNTTPITSIHSSTQSPSSSHPSSPYPTPLSSPEVTSRPFPVWVPGAMPNKRRRIG
jgi:hypothetical protein